MNENAKDDWTTEIVGSDLRLFQRHRQRAIKAIWFAGYAILLVLLVILLLVFGAKLEKAPLFGLGVQGLQVFFYGTLITAWAFQLYAAYEFLMCRLAGARALGAQPLNKESIRVLSNAFVQSGAEEGFRETPTAVVLIVAIGEAAVIFFLSYLFVSANVLATESGMEPYDAGPELLVPLIALVPILLIILSGTLAAILYGVTNAMK